MLDNPAPVGSNRGHIVTFYSYKGGTGRTMALANVAWILAANGYRVLVADWDLESPGLHRYFHPFLDEREVRSATGIIDLVRQYEQDAARAGGSNKIREQIPDRARVQQHALSIRWNYFPGDGRIDFLSAGRQDHNYTVALATLDWDNFYERLDGNEFMNAVRDDMKRNYDYVLIDSRTGLSDIAGICTIQLPDTLVDCFTLSTQGIEGAAQVAKTIAEQHGHRQIRILPVPMRVDQGEKEKVDAGQALAVRLFAGMPVDTPEAQRPAYWADVEVPYSAFYAYEETLAVFGDRPGARTTLLASFERLTFHITNGAVSSLPPFDEHLRARVRTLFTRKMPVTSQEFVVISLASDQLWGEWITDVLRAAGLSARPYLVVDTMEFDQDITAEQRIIVASSDYLARFPDQPAAEASPGVFIYLTASRPTRLSAALPSAFVAGLTEDEVIDELDALLGFMDKNAVKHQLAELVRFPGTEPRINSAPVRNIRFTGREADLRQLRKQMKESAITNQPVCLQGLGGVGKTQLAIEYVHRFKAAYDVIWWIECEQHQFIDASLIDLGTSLTGVYGTRIAETASAAAGARLVLQLLAQGRAGLRWLVVYDNADDVSHVASYLPSGGGNILITAHNIEWASRATPIQLDVFDRADSIEHLRVRVPSIERDDADRVAELLGDMPLAVATAGAWLAETGKSVATYVSELEERASYAMSQTHPSDYPKSVAEAWALSLGQLKQRWPAAARLFDIFSLMARTISLNLFDGYTISNVLEPIDPELAEPMMIDRLVREIEKLALIKLDHISSRIHVHPLLQAVVRDGMSSDELAAVRREVHRVLAGARPIRGIDNSKTWPDFRQIWPHLAPSEAMSSIEDAVRQLYVDRIRYLWLRRDLDNGREQATEVEIRWREMLDAAATIEPALADSLRRQLLRLRFELANILRDLAEFHQAKALDESVLSEQRRVLGPYHPHTLMTAGGLAADLRAVGDYGEALRMDEDTYVAWVREYGDSHPQALRAANNLAVSYRLSGAIKKALQLDTETVQRRRDSLGPPHPQTLRSEVNLVRDLIEVGRYSSAAARIELVRQSCVEMLGADSVEALNAEVLLGVALRSSGNPEEAEPHFQAALKALTARLGIASSETLAARLSHALNQMLLDQVSEAEEEIREVRTIYNGRFGSSHPHTLLCEVNLASVQRVAGATATTVRAADTAADSLQRQLSEDHPYTCAARSVLGVLLADAGRLTEAAEAETSAAERAAVTLGDDHPDTLRYRANLLLMRQRTGSKDVASELELTINNLAKALGGNHPHVKALLGSSLLTHALDPQPF